MLSSSIGIKSCSLTVLRATILTGLYPAGAVESVETHEQAVKRECLEELREWGVPAITDVADVIIDNSGSMESLTRIADAMIARYCPELFV